MAKTKKVVIEENRVEGNPVKLLEKTHLGNVKLSESKSAVKLHIFKYDRFYVIPIQEFFKPFGKIFEYIEGHPELIGEVSPSKDKKHLWSFRIKTDIFYLKDSYVQMLLNETNLTLMIFEE